MIKILIGGSPCTNWSIAQKNNRETTAEGVGWELFKNYLIAKEKFQPNFFLYENNKSAAQPIKDQISIELGVPLQYINSALVSAQNRQRFYAHNIPNVPQPEDRGILLRDILESGVPCRNEKAYCIDANYYKGGNMTGFNRQSGQRLQVAEPVCVAQRGVYSDTMSRAVKTDAPIIQMYEPREDGKTNTLTTVQKDNMVACPVDCLELDGEYYKGGFGDEQKPNLIGKIVCENTSNNNGQPAQCTRIYSPDGKSVCLDADSRKYIIDKAPANGKPIYEVRNGLITIKGKQYPIKLVDGYYIIRKLTVTECCRLQTMPDDYMRAVSATQGYKGLGNGWTAEVIIHILKHANIPLDEEILVLSMYDGIGTGRYCFDKMGYKNIKYYAYENDKYPMKVAQSNYSDIIQCGNAYQVREDNWQIKEAQN